MQQDRCPRRFRPAANVPPCARRLLAGFLLPFAVLWLAGCASALAPEPTVRMEAADLAASRRGYSEMLARFAPYADAAVQRYVQTVGNRLVAKAPVTRNIAIRFTVLDSPGMFAYSFAHGDVVVSRGMLAHLNSEAQLAAVLAHEIGHIVSMHPALELQEMRKAQALEARLSARLATREGREVVSTLGLARVRAYSREYELDADLWSERLLVAAGYEIGGMAQVLRMFIQLESFWDKQGFELWDIPRQGGGEGVFATHPSPDSRLEQAIQRQGRAARAAPAPDPAYLKALHGMVYGLATSYGVQRGRAYAHPDRRVAFTLPPDWYLFGSEERLVAAARNRSGILVIRMVPRPDNETPRQTIEKLANRHTVESLAMHETATVRGQLAIGRLREGNETRSIRLAALDVGTQRLSIVGFTLLPDHWSEMDGRFLALVRTVRALTEPEARRVVPLRVQIEQSMTEGAIARAARVFADHPRERMLLLNQLYPQARFDPGQPVKTIQ